jgi:hypothetical protein
MATLRTWSITLVTAVVTAAVLLVAGFLLVGGGGDQREPLGTGALTPPPVAAPHAARSSSQRPAGIGPEGVPLAAGAPLGPARSPAPGKSSGGVPCGSREQLAYHVHAHVAIFVNGKPRSVPLGIGIGAPVRITKTANGPFASGGSCFSFLHTHAADGIIHIEAPGKVEFRLGQFFDVWQQRLDRRHVGRARGRVVAYVDGRRYRGDPRRIPLRRHAQIQLEVGQPLVAPARISFPQGL